MKPFHNSFTKNNVLKSFVALSCFCFVSGCMTSTRQDELQTSIDKLRDQMSEIQGQLSSKDQQINNTTQTAISSQTEVQGLKDQLQMTQGALDELKTRMKKMEETAGSANSHPGEVTINSSSDTTVSLQKKISRLELITNAQFNGVRKGKLAPKLKNLDEVNKFLKTNFDASHFKQVNDTATAILLSQDSTPEMMATALEYRGEARFQMKDYRGAAADLAGVVDIFANPPRKARALLLAGDSYVYLKDNSIALFYYQDCVKSYAESAEGKAASSRLANLTAQMSAKKPAATPN